MKVVSYATYIAMTEKAAALRPAHREYMTRLHADGRPADDLHQIGGVFAGCRLSRAASSGPIRRCRARRSDAADLV